MKFGLLYEIEVARPWTETSVADCFWEALEQVKVAEQAGFSHVFVVEHHFLDMFSLSSAPEVWLSAVAQHTSKIRIGHGVRLLPFHYNHPVRAAEMAATLDIMSKGRLDFGTGRSASAIELEGFGIDPKTTRAQWDEALHMIPKMWTQETFSWDSPTFKVPPRNVLPKPVQKPHPPIWMSGTQAEDESYAWYRERIDNEDYRERDIQELIDRRSAIVGSAKRCIDAVRWYESQGVDMMLFLVQSAYIRHDDICDSLRRFGCEVI